MDEKLLLTRFQRKKIDKKAFLYPHEYLKLINLLSEKQLFTIKTLINTGARINEARHIEKQDLDKERETLKLRITKVRAKLKETRPTPRTIPISSDFFKYLNKNISNYNIMSTNQTRLILKKYANELKIKNADDFSAHNLRKTFGTWMLAVGVDGYKIAQYLSHSPEMLRTQYASIDIFNENDKMLILQILGNLPRRMININNLNKLYGF